MIIQSVGPIAAGSLDANALTYINAMASAPTEARKRTISDLFTSLKLNGVYAKLDEFWLLAAHTEQAALLGCKRYKDCLAVNAPTFTADRGFVGAVGKYLNTQFTPSTDGVQYTQNGASYGVYVRDNAQVAGYAFGAGMNDNSRLSTIYPRWTDDTFAATVNSTGPTYASGANTDSRGLFAGNRSASGAVQSYKNGSQHATGTPTSDTLIAYPFFIFTRNVEGTPNANVDTRQIAFAFVGASLSATEHSNLFTAVEAYLDAVGAGVI